MHIKYKNHVSALSLFLSLAWLQIINLPVSAKCLFRHWHFVTIYWLCVIRFVIYFVYSMAGLRPFFSSAFLRGVCLDRFTPWQQSLWLSVNKVVVLSLFFSLDSKPLIFLSLRNVCLGIDISWQALTPVSWFIIYSLIISASARFPPPTVRRTETRT